MNALLEKIREAGTQAWLRFVQQLNAILMALLGGALVVHQSYPTLLGDLLGPIPVPLKAAALFAFGAIVHIALRRAKQAGE